MDREIEFSIMAPNADGIQPLLERFEAEQGIRVRLRLLAWDQAWSGLVKAALYNDGPDISEIGTTWLGDLIGMNALRPFNVAELAALGKEQAFLPSAWQVGTITGEAQAGDKRVWAIPWFVGSRLLYYRPELLERAGIEPGNAFASRQHVQVTVARLQASGVKIPWTVPTGLTHTTLHNAASWVWAAGGDFISPDGKATRFVQPEALSGLRDYFALGRYLAPKVRHLNGLEPDDQFLSDPQTAMTISGPWLFNQALQDGEGMRGKVGAALPPGGAFVGGSHLVIWKYSRQAEAAFKLIRFLTQSEAQAAYCQHLGLLPARLEALAAPPFSSDPFWQTAAEGLRSGRTFPTLRLWGLVEDRLTAGLSAVWVEVLADPEQDPLAALEKHLAPLAQRLDLLLKRG